LGWFGIFDRDAGFAGGAGGQFQRPAAGDAAPSGTETALLARGTLRLEFEALPGGDVPARLLHYRDDAGWPRELVVYLNADHSLSVAFRQGPAHAYARLSGIRATGGARLLASCRWDGPARRGTLSVEDPEVREIRLIEFACPLPLPERDARALLRPGAKTRLDPRVSGLALSSRPEPVGPAATIAPQTPVATPEGARPIETLRPGDLVTTLDSGPQPVRWILRQEVPLTGADAPVRLNAPFFGLSRDIVVTARQGILLSGPGAQYHLGRDSVLVRAGELTGHAGATRLPASTPSAVRYQLLFDRHECISLADTWADSLFVGTLARCPAVLAETALAPLGPGALPRHRRPVRTTLSGYEALILRDVLPA